MPEGVEKISPEFCQKEAFNYLKDKYGTAYVNKLNETERTHEEISVVIDCHKNEIYKLYKSLHNKNPRLEGKIVMALNISKEGSVSGAYVKESEIDDKIFLEHMENLFMKFRFNEAVRKIDTTFALEFLA